MHTSSHKGTVQTSRLHQQASKIYLDFLEIQDRTLAICFHLMQQLLVCYWLLLPPWWHCRHRRHVGLRILIVVGSVFFLHEICQGERCCWSNGSCCFWFTTTTDDDVPRLIMIVAQRKRRLKEAEIARAFGKITCESLRSEEQAMIFGEQPAQSHFL
jgi:hypothetical protein